MRPLEGTVLLSYSPILGNSRVLCAAIFHHKGTNLRLVTSPLCPARLSPIQKITDLVVVFLQHFLSSIVCSTSDLSSLNPQDNSTIQKHKLLASFWRSLVVLGSRVVFTSYLDNPCVN